MSASRLCLVVAAILLAVAGALALGAIKGVSAEAVALFGFAFWAVSGAVSG